MTSSVTASASRGEAGSSSNVIGADFAPDNDYTDLDFALLTSNLSEWQTNMIANYSVHGKLCMIDFWLFTSLPEGMSASKYQ
jgi:hypothetical protein